MNIQVIQKTPLDFSQGLASLFEVHVEMAKQDYNLNILHRAGTYVKHNLDSMSYSDLIYHCKIVQIALDDIRADRIKPSSNNKECIDIALHSLRMLQESKKVGISHGFWLNRTIAHLDILSNTSI